MRHECSRWFGLRPVTAGSVYALIVFGVGFVLGTIRVLIVAPKIGEATAVSFEA